MNVFVTLTRSLSERYLLWKIVLWANCSVPTLKSNRQILLMFKHHLLTTKRVSVNLESAILYCSRTSNVQYPRALGISFCLTFLFAMYRTYIFMLRWLAPSSYTLFRDSHFPNVIFNIKYLFAAAKGLLDLKLSMLRTRYLCVCYGYILWCLPLHIRSARNNFIPLTGSLFLSFWKWLV